MAKKGLSAAKAKKILTDGYVKVKPLTAKQKKYFGAIASGATPLKAINGGWLDKYQDGGELNQKYIDSTFNANMDKRWVQRLYEKNPEFYLEGQTKPSTHYMESGDGYVYPRVMEGVDGELKEASREEGRSQGIKFPNDKIAQWFAKNYKKGTNVLKEYQMGGSLPGAQGGGTVKTANTVGNMLGNVGQYFFGIKDEDLQESQYKPTIANETDQKYYTRPGMKRDVFEDLISNRVKKDYNHDGTFKDIYTALSTNGEDRVHNAESAFPKNKAGYKGQYNRGHGSLIGEFNLGRYRTDAGEDDNGKYISFIDKYDWNGMQTENAINYYDRIYEKDWEGFILNKQKEELEAKEKLEKIRNSPTYNKFQDGGVLKAQNGKIIQDDRGQWAHPGEITKINSNNITMKGVNYPVLGISNTGDEQLMMPGEDYKFDGDSVTEYPIAQNGKQLQKLDQLTNFTNYNTPQPGGWLDKYN